MKKTSSVLCKVLAAAMAVALVGGSLASTGIGVAIGVNTEVSAASAGSSPLVTIGDFDYSLRKDGTANVVGYHGKKDLSSDYLSIPTVIYQKDMDVEWKNWEEYQYIGSYKITTVQAGIFSGCKIKLLSLPRYVSAVLGGFTGAEIGGFSVDSSNSYFNTSNSANALYSKDNKTLYAYPSRLSLYNTAINGVVFYNGVTRIDDYAFANAKYSSVKIPATVTYMGDKVFYGSNINTVTFLGNAPTFRFMPDDTATDHGTFEGAAYLGTIAIEGKDGKYNTYNGAIYDKDYSILVLCPQGRTTSSSFVFSEKCKTVGSYAFYNCSKLTAITLPEGVTNISPYSTFYKHNANLVFYVTQGSYGQTWAQNNGYDYIIYMPYIKNSDGTLTITGYNGKPTSISIPSTICGSKVTAIADSAFKDNKDLTFVSISYGVKKIGERAFSGCTSLASVYLPGTLEKVGKYAFYNTAITKLTIPSAYTNIDEYAFYFCTALKEVQFYEQLKSIGTYAFAHCRSLESVSIPQSTETLGMGCFFDCTSLSVADIGSGVKTIGAFAFEDTALTTQYIPQNVTTINTKAFGYNYNSSGDTHTRNSKFTSISGILGSAAETYAKNNGIPFNSAFGYSVGTDGVTITSFSGNDKDLDIPSSIGDKPVVAIGEEAFKYNTKIEAVTIPSSVKKINSKAFYGCSNLKTLRISEGLTDIGQYAFGFCTKLSSITLPSSTKIISSGAFYNCTNLKSVYFNSGLEFVGQFAFTNTGLTSVNVPRSVSSIGAHAFGYTYTDSGYSPVSGFEMTGYAYSMAETYAKNNTHIKFNAKYDTFVNTSSISAAVIDLGDSITITGSATGGKLPYTYYVTYVHSSDSSETSLQGYGGTFEFTPEKAGNYTFYVKAVDDRGVSDTKTFNLAVKSSPLKNESTVSKTDITLGEKIKVYGKASGGKSPYLYGVYIKKATSENWTTVQSYKSNDVIPVSFAAAVKYDLCVKVKDKSGKIEKKYFTINVTKPLENKSVISADTIKLGESVTVTGKASGGTTPYLYGVYYKKATSETWSTAQSYKKNSVVKITPKAAVKYDICVKVKDNSGKIEKKYFTLTVTKK